MDFPNRPPPREPLSSVLPGFVRGLGCRPFFRSAAMLMNLDSSTVQHQRSFINDVMLNQVLKQLFPYALLRPAVKSAVHAVPRAESFRQISPWYPCVQPIDYAVKH